MKIKFHDHERNLLFLILEDVKSGAAKAHNDLVRLYCEKLQFQVLPNCFESHFHRSDLEELQLLVSSANKFLTDSLVKEPENENLKSNLNIGHNLNNKLVELMDKLDQKSAKSE